jgi:hypothetical protein
MLCLYFMSMLKHGQNYKFHCYKTQKDKFSQGNRTSYLMLTSAGYMVHFKQDFCLKWNTWFYILCL